MKVLLLPTSSYEKVGQGEHVMPLLLLLAAKDVNYKERKKST